jgi:RNA polymerase sigma-70 factor, ECF subfamily
MQKVTGLFGDGPVLIMTNSATTDDESDLLSRARQFDPLALGQIYDAYFERLYRYAYRFVYSSDAAQDIAAETLHRFLEALHDDRAPNQHLAAWMYRVARNLAIDAYRRMPPGGVLSLNPELNQAGESDTAAAAEQRIANAQVRDAFAHLTPEQQHVLVLKFVEGYTNTEIGSLMQKPEGAIKSLQHRALAALRRLLQHPARKNQ